jgi:VanZ family protein
MKYRITLLTLAAVALVLSFLDSTIIEHLYRSLLTVVGLDGVKVETVSDLGHIVAGFFLTLLALSAFPRRTVAVLSALLLFFVAIEFFQGFTATRSMSLDDLFRSGLGIGGGFLFRTAMGFGGGGK